MTRLPEGGAPLGLVLDTNIVISRTLWQGAPRTLLSLAGREDRVSLFTSVALLAELTNTLAHKALSGFGYVHR